MLVRLRMGMQKKGIHPKFIDQVTQQIKGFAEYGFPESHATSFALIAYASCYLKCHFPAAFTVALLNSQPMGFYSPHALIQDAKRHGIAVLPICVQKSFYETTLELQENDGVSVYAIRLGFHLVSGLRQASIDCVLHERSTNGPWESLQDFIHRTNISRPDLTYIAAADALAAFHIDRRSALWLSEALPIPPLLDCAEEHEHSLPAEEPLDRMQNDFHATSTTLGKHPTELVREEYWSYDISPSKVWNSQQLKDNSSRRMVDVFGMVLVRQAPPSAKGMVFMTLEDAHGYINLVFDPKTFELHRSVINEHGFICAHGELQNIEESVSVLVRRVHKPVVMRADVVPLHSSTLIQSQPSGDLPLVISEFHQSRNYS
jgi:error-prone DNA polymerase